MKTLREAEAATPDELKGMTPPQVDELFAAVDEQRWKLYSRILDAKGEIHWAVGDKKVRGQGWRLTFTEAQRKARESVAKDPAGSSADALAELDKAYAALDDLNKGVQAKLDAEYERRGKWSRAWLVTDGHAHNTENCSSCHKGEFRTPLYWMTEYSGKSQAEIIEAAADRACSICYPDAPVNRGEKVPKSVMFTADETERDRVRKEQAAKLEEKKAKAAASGITYLDGTPLREEVDRDGRQCGSVLKTIRAARSRVKTECWYGYVYADNEHERSIQHLGRAVAWRENDLAIGEEPTREQIDAVVEPLRAKAIKEVEKARREAR